MVSRQKISIITPCFNEEANLEECAARVRKVFLGELKSYDYEHIFSDNCSSDRSADVLRKLAEDDKRIKVILNSRNVGPFRNMAIGLRRVSGELIVPMIPADCQDPPEAIPDLLHALEKNVDVVYGIRTNRGEGLLMTMARNLYYKIVTFGNKNTSPPPHAGEFLLARRNIITSILPSLGSYPYIRGLVSQATQRFTTVKYVWGARQHGKSRNSLGDLFDQGLNGFVSTARAPIRIALFIGTILSFFGLLYALTSILLFTFNVVHVDPGIPTLIVAVSIFGGLQLLFLGLIGEYVVSIFTELRPGPTSVMLEEINFD